MPTRSHSAPDVALSLPAAERWTLHHVLLDRIEREPASDATAAALPIEVFRAFEALDGGGTRFKVGQLEAVRDVLAEYQRRTDWEVERAAIERLLSRVSTAVEEARRPAN